VDGVGSANYTIRIWSIGTESDLQQGDGCSIPINTPARITGSVAIECAGIDLDICIVDGKNCSAHMLDSNVGSEG
jgi:hypothetical protein